MAKKIVARPSADPSVVFLASDHCKQVGEKSAEYAAKFGCELLGLVQGLFHDHGKFGPRWQEYIATLGTKVPHAITGALALVKRFGLPSWKRPNALHAIIFAITSHHSGLPDCDVGGTGETDLISRLKDPKNVKLYEEADPHFNKEMGEIEDPTAPDWFECKPGFHVPTLIRMATSALVDGDRVATEKDLNPTVDRSPRHDLRDLRDRLNAHIKALNTGRNDPLSIERTRLQEACLAAASKKGGIYTLDAPPGLGKTLSGMAFCFNRAVYFNLDRVIYLGPFISVIEQTANLLRSIFGKDGILEQHSALTDDADLSQHAALGRENWGSDRVIVTTVVQFFESFFSHRTKALRKLHNVANSVIFIDEVQTIPAHLVDAVYALISELSKPHYNVTFVLASATIPPKLSLGATHLVSDSDELARSMLRVSIKVRRNPISITDLAAETTMTGKSTLVILNFRKQAIELYQTLKPLVDETTDLFHLSAGMCPAHRSDVIAAIKTNLKRSDRKTLVVATSLIEAGVDIDFPCVFRAHAGLDSLLQSAGRCNREGKMATLGDFRVFSLSCEFSAKADRRSQAKALAAEFFPPKFTDTWEPCQTLFDPDNMRSFFASMHRVHDPERIIEKSKMLLFRQVSEAFKFIPDLTTSVIVPYGEEGKRLVADLQQGIIPPDVFARAQRYTVNEYQTSMTRNENISVFHVDNPKIWYTVQPYYDEIVGFRSSTRLDNDEI